jgi:hypothetical protein
MSERAFERATWCDGASVAGSAANAHWCLVGSLAPKTSYDSMVHQ